MTRARGRRHRADAWRDEIANADTYAEKVARDCRDLRIRVDRCKKNNDFIEGPAFAYRIGAIASEVHFGVFARAGAASIVRQQAARSYCDCARANATDASARSFDASAETRNQHAIRVFARLHLLHD
jgi:hypothetical protein